MASSPAKPASHEASQHSPEPKPGQPEPKAPNPLPDGPGIAEEQRARSAEYEKGHYPPDERTPEEAAPKQVQGVAPPAKRS